MVRLGSGKVGGMEADEWRWSWWGKLRTASGDGDDGGGLVFSESLEVMRPGLWA